MKASGPPVQQGNWVLLKVFRGIVVALGLMQGGAAWAMPPIIEWLGLVRAPINRAALGSGTGRAFLSAVGVADEEALAYLLASGGGASARSAAIRTLGDEFQSRLLSLQKQIDTYREEIALQRVQALATGNRRLALEISSQAEIGERLLASRLGHRLFALGEGAEEWTRLLREGQADLVGMRSGQSARFFKALESAEDPFEGLRKASTRVAITAAEKAELGGLRRGFRSLQARMQVCLQERAPAQRLRQRLAYWLGEVAIEATMTTGSAIGGQALAQVLERGEAGSVTTGQIEVSLDNLPNDILTSVFATSFGTGALAVSDRYRVQWFAYTAYQVGIENTFDAVTYLISPAERMLQEDPSLPTQTDALAQHGVASAYSLANSWHEVGVFRWVDGLSCLAQGNFRAQAAITGFRTLYSFGGHLTYFALRYNALNH